MKYIVMKKKKLPAILTWNRAIPYCPKVISFDSIILKIYSGPIFLNEG